MSDLPEYLTKAGLKARGWTEKAIAMFLGDCDREAKNPIFRSADPAVRAEVRRLLQEGD